MLDKQKLVDILQGGIADVERKLTELTGRHALLQNDANETSKNVILLTGESNMLKKVLKCINTGSLDVVTEEVKAAENLQSLTKAPAKAEKVKEEAENQNDNKN